MPDNRKVGALEDPVLAIQRLLIGDLGHQHLSQQSHSRDSLIEHLRQHRLLDHRLPRPAAPNAVDVPFYLEQPWDVPGLFARIFLNSQAS